MQFNLRGSYKPNSLNHSISLLPNVRRLVEIRNSSLCKLASFISNCEKYDEAEDKLSLQAELAAVKYAVTNAAISIVDKSMRIVGAKVYQKNPLHRYYLNVRAGLQSADG